MNEAVDPMQYKKDQTEQMKKVWKDNTIYSQFSKIKDEIDL